MFIASSVRNPSFSAELGFSDFNEFLESHQRDFGSTLYNRFIIEYKLILMFNEFALLVDAAAGKIAPVPHAKEKVKQLYAGWKILEKIVNEFIKIDKDCVFSHYLNFVLNYTMAKALEFDFHVLVIDLSTDEDQGRQSDRQQFYISQAEKSLESIHLLFQVTAAQHIKGIEFCFGQNLFNKLPMTNFDMIRKHVASLQQPRPF